MNFDYWFTSNFGGGAGPDFSNLSIWGIATAGRYALTEATGFGLRYEFLGINDFANTDGDLMSFTATLDHRLTDSLLVRAEARWDRARLDGASDDVFVSNYENANSVLSFSSNHQVLGLVQMMYEF
jgi:outer membrane receptor for monomeric catechols